jgi:hypothetical protein
LLMACPSSQHTTTGLIPPISTRIASLRALMFSPRTFHDSKEYWSMKKEQPVRQGLAIRPQSISWRKKPSPTQETAHWQPLG